MMRKIVDVLVSVQQKNTVTEFKIIFFYQDMESKSLCSASRLRQWTSKTKNNQLGSKWIERKEKNAHHRCVTSEFHLKCILNENYLGWICNFLNLKSQRSCVKGKTEPNIEMLTPPPPPQRAALPLINQRVYFEVQYKETHRQLLQKRR